MASGAEAPASPSTPGRQRVPSPPFLRDPAPLRDRTAPAVVRPAAPDGDSLLEAVGVIATIAAMIALAVLA